jgi:hypothetical protein
MKILFASVVLAGCSISSSAMAGGCIVAHYSFHPALSDTVTAHIMTTTGKCRHSWSAGGRLEFTSASIVDFPHNGKLTKTGTLSFHYAANKGFKGSDTYSFSVCGKSSAGSGCSKIIYDMSVE